MVDKVQLIKEEIERLINDKTDEKHVAKADIIAPKGAAYLDILHFIDSIPEEPASEDFASEDLEEEIDRFAKTVVPSRSKTITKNNISLCAKHFAHWQHGKDFDDLLQSEMKFPNEYYDRGKADAMKEMKEALQTEYEKGRFDMREEMMKDALSGQIYRSHDGDVKILAVKGNTDKLYRGTDIKFIILKTE